MFNSIVSPANQTSAFFSPELHETPADGLFARLVKDHGPLQNNLDSFNHWAEVIMPMQIASRVINDATGVHYVKNARLGKPQMASGDPLMPAVARVRGLTYAAPLYGDIVRISHENASDSSVVSNVVVGRIPVMLGSHACHLHGLTREELNEAGEDIDDPFGYFIIRGGERIIVNQETLAFGQQITKEDTSVGSAGVSSVETRVTNQGMAGSTVLSATIGDPCPTVNITIFQSGMKTDVGNVRPAFPVYVIFDLLLTQIDPAKYSGSKEAVEAEVSRLMKMFIRDKVKYDSVMSFLTASRMDYRFTEDSKNKIIESITNLIGATKNFETAAAMSLTSKARRTALEFVMNGGGTVTTQAVKEAAASVANGIAPLSLDQQKDLVVSEVVHDIFPYAELTEKPIHLARIVAQECLVAKGLRTSDNRDNWENKRIKLAADRMAQLLNGMFRPTVNRFGELSIDQQLADNYVASFGPTGWNGKKIVVHMYKRDTPMASISQVSRVNVDAPRQSKQASIRLVQSSQLGYICPAETPSSEACGLTKNMACTASVALRRDQSEYISVILEPTAKDAGIPMKLDSFVEGKRDAAVIVDNKIITWSDGPVFAHALFTATKRSLAFFDVCVFYNEKDHTVNVYTIGSRPIRPLLVVDKATKRLVIDSIPGGYSAPVADLVTSGAIAFVHAGEQQRSLIIEDREKVHTDAHIDMTRLPVFAEIDPQALLGISAVLMPLPNTCQGPRVSYQAGMATQALGLYHDNYHRRFETFKRIETSRPFFETRIAKIIGSNRSPTGRMFMVAYVAMANNGEDGIVFKAEALERLRLTKYTTHKVIIRGLPRGAPLVNVFVEKLALPEESAKKPDIYEAIGEDGLPRIGAVIKKHSCIVGKVQVTYNETGVSATSNESLFAGIGDEGVVDAVNVSYGVPPSSRLVAPTDKHNGTPSETMLFVRVRVRQTRPVIAGDKLASRYSQKGTVATKRAANPAYELGTDFSHAAALPHATDVYNRAAVAEAHGMNEEAIDGGDALPTSSSAIRLARDLPRVASGPNKGMVPDIFINPLSMPSRMTIGMLIEMLASKASLYTGERYDGTAFRDISDARLEGYRQALESAGLDRDGYETMEHSDGTPFREGVKVFVAPCFYQSLRHTVSDKIQQRSEGTVFRLTRQPVHGRSRGGGLRQGEMERTAMCSWAATNLITERLVRASDQFDLPMCGRCGRTVNIDHSNAKYACSFCPPGRDAVGILKTSYISQLISNMVRGLGINPVFKRVHESLKEPDFAASVK